MKIVAENSLWVVATMNVRVNSLKIVNKLRKRYGMRPYTATAVKDRYGRIVISSKFPIPVNVRNWITKWMNRGKRFK